MRSAGIEPVTLGMLGSGANHYSNTPSKMSTASQNPSLQASWHERLKQDRTHEIRAFCPALFF